MSTQVQAIDDQIAALEKQKKELLQEARNEDLSTVKMLCKKHNFTPRMLKGFIGEGRKRRSRAEMAAAS